MKENWTYKKLGEVAEVQNGYAFKSSQYVDKGIRIMRISNVQKGVVEDNDPAFYPLSAQNDLLRYMLKENDILLSLTGNVGRVGLLQKDLLPAALNQRVACLRISSSMIELKFLFLYLNSNLFEQKCIASSRGIAQLNMSTEWLKEQLIPLPPLSEQQSIVRELDLLNDLIAKKRAQVAEYDQLQQSLFYTMFGDPVTNEKGWEVKKLGEVAPIKKYEGPIYEKEGKVWLLNLDMIESQTGNICDYLWEKESEIGNSTTTFNENYVLYSKLRPYLNKVVIPKHSGYCTTELLPLLPSKVLHKTYLAFCLRSKSFVDYINIKVAGAKMPRVTMDDFRGFSLPLPPLPLQQEFAKKVEAIEALKAKVNDSIRETETLLASRMDYYFG